MALQKSWFSYVLWAFYAFCAAVFHIEVMYELLRHTPLKDTYVQVGIVCLSFVLAAGIFFLARHIVIRCQKKKVVFRGKSAGIITEACLAVLIFGTGLFLRVYSLGSGGEEAAYFETAMVTGNSVPVIAYGAQYLYVLLLRAVFYLMGNHFVAGVILQLSLQMIAAVVWYFAVRRLFGVIPAAVFFAGIMLLPQSIQAGLTLSPKMLYALLYGIVLLMSGRFLGRQKRGLPLQWYSWLHTVFTGIGIGLLSYLDIMGFTLFIPVFFLLFVKPESGDRKSGVLLAQQLVVVLTAVITAAMVMYMDAGQNGTGFVDVLKAWMTLFGSKGIGTLPQMLKPVDFLTICLMPVVSVALILGIPAFFVKKREDSQMSSFVLLLGFGVIQAGSFMVSAGDCEYLLFSLLLITAGAGIRAMVQQETRAATEIATEAVQMIEAAENVTEKTEEKQIIELMNEEKEIQQKVVEDGAAMETPERKPVKFIENPLPLPKKHEKKTMGFAIEPEETKMQFDIEVSEDDDFDIK